MKRLLSLALCMLLLCGALAGCAPATEDLMEGITAREVNAPPALLSGETSVDVTNFAVRLFRAGFEAGENTMLSPVSVLCALSMAANGAKGDTLAQMEEVLGTEISELNSYLKAYADALPQGEDYTLRLANSIWLTKDGSFSAEQDFLQTTADYYGADIFRLPFDDAALRQINGWVEENTDGMIEEILTEISQEAVMYLVNAVAFDARWSSVYNSRQVRNGVFTSENGGETPVELMRSKEHRYLEDENATGFIKYYADSKYAFVALLPREGMRISDYISTLTGEGLSTLLASPQNTEVTAAIPKFESEYSVELSGILSGMGMEDAFDSIAADFSALGTSSVGNIFINRVLHKTFISVAESGTRAGAATAVEMVPSSALMPAEEPKEVILDRPFVYLIVDCEAMLPLFLGVLMDVN